VVGNTILSDAIQSRNIDIDNVMLDVGITGTGNHTYTNWLSQFTTTCTTCATQQL